MADSNAQYATTPGNLYSNFRPKIEIKEEHLSPQSSPLHSKSSGAVEPRFRPPADFPNRDYGIQFIPPVTPGGPSMRSFPPAPGPSFHSHFDSPSSSGPQQPFTPPPPNFSNYNNQRNYNNHLNQQQQLLSQQHLQFQQPHYQQSPHYMNNHHPHPHQQQQQQQQHQQHPQSNTGFSLNPPEPSGTGGVGMSPKLPQTEGFVEEVLQECNDDQQMSLEESFEKKLSIDEPPVTSVNNSAYYPVLPPPNVPGGFQLGQYCQPLHRWPNTNLTPLSFPPMLACSSESSPSSSAATAAAVAKNCSSLTGGGSSSSSCSSSSVSRNGNNNKQLPVSALESTRSLIPVVTPAAPPPLVSQPSPAASARDQDGLSAVGGYVIADEFNPDYFETKFY